MRSGSGRTGVDGEIEEREACEAGDGYDGHGGLGGHERLDESETGETLVTGCLIVCSHKPAYKLGSPAHNVSLHRQRIHCFDLTSI